MRNGGLPSGIEIFGGMSFERSGPKMGYSARNNDDDGQIRADRFRDD